MRWGVAIALVALVLVMLAGCGGSGESASTESGGGSVASLLIAESDLPSGEVRTESIPESCSPILLLEESELKTVGTPFFRLDTDTVGEVIGIAASKAEARQALAELHSSARLECIKATIESFGLQPGELVKIDDPESTDAADEGSVARLTRIDAASEPTASTTLVSMRAGRCVATLLFVREGRGSGREFVDQLSGEAQGRVEGAASICR